MSNNYPITERALTRKAGKAEPFSLPRKVAVYVPGTYGLDGERDNSDVVQVAAKLLSDRFGGATAVKADGYYVADNGQLITEKTVIVYASADDLGERDVEYVVNLAANIRDFLRQECVAYEIDGALWLV